MMEIVERNLQLLQPFILLMVLPVIQVLSLPNVSQQYSQSAIEKEANHLMEIIQKTAGSSWNCADSQVHCIYMYLRKYNISCSKINRKQLTFDLHFKSVGYIVPTLCCNFEENCRIFSYTSKCSHKSEGDF